MGSMADNFEGMLLYACSMFRREVEKGRLGKTRRA